MSSIDDGSQMVQAQDGENVFDNSMNFGDNDASFLQPAKDDENYHADNKAEFRKQMSVLFH
jgi:hypothetical protein